MSTSSALVLLLIGIIVSLALGVVLKMNAGIAGFAVSLLLGYWAFGLKTRDIIALFPTASFFQIMVITMFFGFVVENGAMKNVGLGILYRFRKARSFMLIFVMLVATVAIGILCGSPTPPLVVMGIICFSITKDSDINPLIVVPVLGCGAAIGSTLPTGDNGSVVLSTLQSVIPDSALLTHFHIWGGLWVASIILIVIYFFVFRVHKIKSVNMEKPEPLTAIQKKGLIILGGAFAFMIIPQVLKLVVDSPALTKFATFFDVQTCCILGSIVMIIFKIAPQRKVIVHQIPWNVLILFSGMTVLISLGKQIGAIDYLASLITENVPTILIYPVIALVCGFLSFFAGTFSTIFPMMAPLMVTMAAQNPQLSAAGLLTTVIVGANASCVSPFSGGGSTLLGASAEVFGENTDHLFNAQLTMAVVSVFIVALLSMTGIFNII